MNGADPGRWSDVAAAWSALWGGLADPLWAEVARVSGAGPGSRALDVGCGAGDLVARMDAAGLAVAGLDPAPGMLAHARSRLPAADLRPGGADRLPWPDRSFDLVTAVNALQFADDTVDALAEAARVTAPGGHVVVANWAEASRNDLAVLEDALTRDDGEEPAPDGELRLPGGLEALFAEAGLATVAAGLVELPWTAAGDETLVAAVLLGEDAGTVAARAPVVLAAARPFRAASGSYHLTNHFRYAVSRVP